MACVAMDTSFPDSTEAVELGRRLGERLAWCHACRLWAWGIDQNREDGTVQIDDERIAAVADWRGDPHAFVEAMVAVGLLRPIDGGGYYMTGWSRNKEYFSKKRRMRDYRDKKKAEREEERETPQESSSETPRVTPPDAARVPRSRSRSPSLKETDHLGLDADAVKNRLGRTILAADLELALTRGAPYTESEFQGAVAETERRIGKAEPTYVARVLAGIREKKAVPPQQRTAQRRDRDPGDQVYRVAEPRPPPTAAERAASIAAAKAAREKLAGILGEATEVA